MKININRSRLQVGAVIASIMEAYVPWESVMLLNRPVPRGLVAVSSTKSESEQFESEHAKRDLGSKLKGPSVKKRRHAN